MSRSVTLITPSNVRLDDFHRQLEAHWHVYSGSIPWDYVQVQPSETSDDKPGPYWVQITDSCNDYFEGELDDLPITDPNFFQVEFDSFRLLKQVLLVIADDPNIWIDNTDDVIMRGSDVAERIRREPAWNLDHPSRLTV